MGVSAGGFRSVMACLDYGEHDCRLRVVGGAVDISRSVPLLPDYSGPASGGASPGDCRIPVTQADLELAVVSFAERYARGDSLGGPVMSRTPQFCVL